MTALILSMRPAFASPSSLPTHPDGMPMGDLFHGPSIRATRRISVPFGFNRPLPLMAADFEVQTSGPGGCTAGEDATVAITITQSMSGVYGLGNWSGVCTGQLQIWNTVVTVQTTVPFLPGDALACGFATTKKGGIVTDTFEWCKQVTLGQELFLPQISKP